MKKWFLVLFAAMAFGAGAVADTSSSSLNDRGDRHWMSGGGPKRREYSLGPQEDREQDSRDRLIRKGAPADLALLEELRQRMHKAGFVTTTMRFEEIAERMRNEADRRLINLSVREARIYLAVAARVDSAARGVAQPIQVSEVEAGH